MAKRGVLRLNRSGSLSRSRSLLSFLCVSLDSRLRDRCDREKGHRSARISVSLNVCAWWWWEIPCEFVRLCDGKYVQNVDLLLQHSHYLLPHGWKRSHSRLWQEVVQPLLGPHSHRSSRLFLGQKSIHRLTPDLPATTGMRIDAHILLLVM